MSSTPHLNGGGMRTVERLSSGCCIPGLDQTQPGRIVWIQSGKPSGYVTGEYNHRHLQMLPQSEALRTAIK